jgi:uncharacterized protein (DUF305 family)
MRSSLLALVATAVTAWLLVQSPRPAAQVNSTMHTHSQPSSAQAWESAGGFPRALYDATIRMHEDMLRTPPSGSADVDFLVQMIPHHEGAVEMARLYLISGNDPLVRRLAEEIIASQQAEIAAMKARLEILRKGPDPSPDGFPSLGGTRAQ